MLGFLCTLSALDRDTLDNQVGSSCKMPSIWFMGVPVTVLSETLTGRADGLSERFVAQAISSQFS